VAEIDLLQYELGLVVAPAGCGKTHLITEAVQANHNDKPILVLTHTNAGVAALRQRMISLGIHPAKYKLITIDGWIMRLVNMFPVRSEYNAGPHTQNPDYAAIRNGALKLVSRGHISSILRANFSHVIVDEYQDCGPAQHAIISELANILPTCVLGDPMQGIFGWPGNPLADWNNDVCTRFPLVGELSTPWRWDNASNSELGLWLLRARSILSAGQPLSLDGAPSSVYWIQLDGNFGTDRQRLVGAARCQHKSAGDKTLIIGDSMNASSRFQIAKSIPGIITVEPVHLNELINFSRLLDLTSARTLTVTLDFAAKVITNVGPANIVTRLETLRAGREKTPASTLELAALELQDRPSFSSVVKVLSACSAQTGSRTYRPRILRAAIRALNLASGQSSPTLQECAIRIREENRVIGRQLPDNAIGSTLLLKGLESDHVVVLNAGELDAKNLYVAMTRGAKSVTLCSRERVF